MKTIILTALPFLTVSVLSAHMAHAENVTLTISGVIQPRPCTMDIANGGAFAFGNVSTDRLAPPGATTGGAKGSPYTVNCPGGARIALKIADNREGTESVQGGTPTTNHFGVGTDSSRNKIGYNIYELAGHPLVNGDTGIHLSTRDGGRSWAPISTPVVLDHLPEASVSFAASGDNLPATVEIVTGNINVGLTVGDQSGLDLSQEVDVDGSATLELVYL